MNCPNCTETLTCEDFWILDITNPERMLVAIQCMGCDYYAEVTINFNNFKVISKEKDK